MATQAPTARSLERRDGRPRSDRRDVAAVALGLGIVAGVTYAVTFHPDWLVWDPFQDAFLIQRDNAAALLGPQHVLTTLVPLGAFRALHALGYDARAMPILAALSIAGAAAAVALTFLAGIRLGASRTASAAAAAALAVTVGMWAAGATAAGYGMAQASIAFGWLAGAGYLLRPTRPRAATLGLATGLAVATHLANMTFVPSAVLLVALAPTTEALAARARVWVSLVWFAIAAILASLPLFVIAAGVEAGFSPGGIIDWFLRPRIGGATDTSAAIGWGVEGLLQVVAGRGPDPWRAVITLAFVVFAVGKGVRLIATAGSGRLLGVALLLHPTLAFLLASWFSAIRADYFGLGLIPLALAAAAGRPIGFPAVLSRYGDVRRIAGAVTVLSVAGLAAWNLTTDVVPSLELSRRRGAAATLIAGRVPARSHLVVSPFVAARLAEQGLQAETAWGALGGAVAAGAPKPGIAKLIEESRTTPVFVSTEGFKLLPAQVALLGAGPGEIWSSLRECCRLEPFLRFRTGWGQEVLYRVVARRG